MSTALLAMAGGAPRRRASELWCLAAALALHGACVAFAHGEARLDPPVPRIVSEIELAPPPAPAPAPPEPEPEPEPPPPVEPASPRAARGAAQRRAARAGPLLTAPDTPAVPDAAEPVRFVTDPHGQGYGHGVVARGGTAQHGTGAHVSPEPAAQRPSGTGETITPADRLQRPPVLRGHDGCRGYFPATARHDRGSVTLIATVRANGAIARLEVESETPSDDGFAKAARACLTALRFEPALDLHGRPAAARTRVHIQFTR